MIKKGKKLVDLSIDAQKLIINALWKSGYPLKLLLDAEITAPKNALSGTCKVTTGYMTGFSLNVSKKDVEAVGADYKRQVFHKV